jgi:hypothetical protein
MKTRLYTFFNNPYVAFPLMVALLVVFLWVVSKADLIVERYSIHSNGTVKTTELGG